MGSINFSGAGTGIDWSLIVDYEVQARTRRVVTPLQNWKDSWETKISVFDALSSQLGDLQSAVQAMDEPDELLVYAAQAGDATELEAEVTGTAAPGSHTLEINQLAGAETEIHTGVHSEQTVVNNSGVSQYFAYTYAGESVTLEVENGTTLEQLAGLINESAANPGVTASVLDDGGGSATSHHLTLLGQDTGSTYTIAVDAAGTTLAGDWGTLSADAAAGASALTVDDPSPFVQYQAVLVSDDDSAAEYHVISSVAGNVLNLQGTLADSFTVAQNAYATPRGIGSGLSAAASAAQNEVTVDDASPFVVGQSVLIADGAGSEELTISAVDTTTNTLTFETNLTNAYGADAYATQLEGGRHFTFEDTAFDEVQSARNAQVRLNGYPPSGWIERKSNVVGDLIPGVTLTLAGTTAGTPVTITINADTEAVKGKIQAFVDAYNAVKRFLNEKTSYSADTEQAGTLLGNYAATILESMLRDVVINEAVGFTDGVDTYTHLRQVGIQSVGRTDDKMDLGTLEIDDEALDAALAEDFEAVVQIFASDFSGYSDSSYLTFYQASGMLTTAGVYDVQADFDGTGTLIAGRMKLSTESTYRDAAVDPPYVVGVDGNPEHALYVKAAWDGVSTTQSATVSVKRGIAGSIADMLDDLLDSTDGLIHNIDVNYRDIIKQIDVRIEQEERRIGALKDRLTAKYARLEQLLVELQGQQTWAANMASSMSTEG